MPDLWTVTVQSMVDNTTQPRETFTGHRVSVQVFRDGAAPPYFAMIDVFDKTDRLVSVHGRYVWQYDKIRTEGEGNRT